MVTKFELIDFEKEVVELFNDGKLKSPVHLSGGNEDQVISIFERIKPTDWVFSTYRSHYHALLHGISKEWLKNWILENKSIHVMNNEHKFWTSAIVAGTLPVALGVALGLKLNSQDGTESLGSKFGKSHEVKHPDTHVWCFVGDMTGHTGVFWECINYAHNHKLPITFVIEDNGLSTDTPTSEVWNIPNQDYYDYLAIMFPGTLMYYKYDRVFPHYGTGKFVSKLWEKVDETKAKGF